MFERKSTPKQLGARLSACFGLLFALMFVNVGAWSQATQGSIVGVVRDPQGALVSGATVTLTNIDAGVTRTTRTKGSGEYAFLDVVAGHYQLTVEAAGFQRYQVENAALAVRQQLRIDAQLSIGGIQQQIDVKGDAVSAIETESPTISGVLTAAEASSLPVNTRASHSGTSAAAILGSLPGAQADQSGVSLQGALPFEMDVTVDGVTTKSAGGGGYIGDAFPSSEAISEIRADGVLTNAEYGYPAQVIITTKGGTNKFHGSAFVYYQDNNWNAHPYYYEPYAQPKWHATTFGGSIGGPVMLPHYNGRNKTFFFFDYEGWRNPSQAVLSEVVPSTGMINVTFPRTPIRRENPSHCGTLTHSSPGARRSPRVISAPSRRRLSSSFIRSRTSATRLSTRTTARRTGRETQNQRPLESVRCSR